MFCRMNDVIQTQTKNVDKCPPVHRPTKHVSSSQQITTSLKQKKTGKTYSTHSCRRTLNDIIIQDFLRAKETNQSLKNYLILTQHHCKRFSRYYSIAQSPSMNNFTFDERGFIACSGC